MLFFFFFVPLFLELFLPGNLDIREWNVDVITENFNALFDWLREI